MAGIVLHILEKTKRMLYILTLSIFALYLLYLPIFVKVNTTIDMESGSGSVSLAVFNIYVFVADGLLEIRSVTESDLIIKYQKRQKNVHIKIDRRSIREVIDAIKRFEFSIFSNLNVRKVDASITYGNGDAIKTMFYLGLFKMLFYSAMSVVKSNQHVDIKEHFSPDYAKRTLKVEASSIFSLSVADIIYGFIRGKIFKFKKWRKQKKAYAS